MEFVSEPITPEPGRFSGPDMSRGLASLPTAFTWRGERFVIAECLDHAKLTSNEGATAQGETYLRGQRFTVRLADGRTAVLHFRRQTSARWGSLASKARWMLFTISKGVESERGPTPPSCAPNPGTTGT